MVNLKKYNRVLKLFVIFLTVFLIISCAKTYYTTRIEAKRIPVSNIYSQTQEIEKYIAPYRENIDKDMNTVLAYCPETLDKSSGKWQTIIGNLMADVCLSRGNLVFNSREKKQIDMCVLNHGGIRSILPKGNVTTRTAFEIMPFENSLVVVALKGETVMELIDYFIKTQKPHPLSGITFVIDTTNQPKDIKIQGNAFDYNKVYYVATNDYLSNGGDGMTFFQKGIQTYDVNYKLRNILIDYFKEIDTVAVPRDSRVIVE